VVGAPGNGAPGSGNPADLTRGTISDIDADGVPEHLNKTSPFVDQNQAYGSNALVGQFLREGDGHGGLTGHLLAGAADPSNPAFSLLPNLREAIQHHWANNTVFTDPSLQNGSTTFRQYFAGLVDANGVINQSMVDGLASNFMGSGHALLLDTNPFINKLDHYVAGDGRANENIGLTSIHTIWARNHNFQVESLKDAGFTGTAEELFQAAKVINEAEYQRVVFTEFADKMLGGLKGHGDHGFDGYNPDVDARISHEFSTAAYRFGHSLINETMTVLDANGQPHQVDLFDAFLNPTNDASAFPVDPSAYYTPKAGYEQLGVNGILGGGIIQQAEEVDVNIVNAVRNDLVRINADVFAFDVAREWDVGIGTMNQIRADLRASQSPYVQEAVGYAGNFSPYTSWDDFQLRNGLSDAVSAQFKQAYPDLVLAAADIDAFKAINPGIELGGPNHNTVKGIDRVDLFVGGLAEQHINGGMVGQTMWVILHEQMDRLQEGDRLYYIDRVENLDFYQQIEEQGFGAIIARNTGLSNLPENVFEVSGLDQTPSSGGDTGTGAGTGTGDHTGTGGETTGTGDHTGTGVGTGGTGTGDDGGSDDNDGPDDDAGSGDDTGSDGHDGSSDDEDQPDTGTGMGTGIGTGAGTGTGSGTGTGTGTGNNTGTDTGTQTDTDTQVSTAGVVRTGTPQADVLAGTAGDDNIVAMGGDDVITSDAGADAINAGAGDDFVSSGDGRDVVFAGAGDDQVFAGDQADVIYGDAGNDRIFGGEGNDLLNAGAGDDAVFGGAGNDLIVAEANDGNDVYFGDDSDGGSGIDTLDLSASAASVRVNLGSGLLFNGFATGVQIGHDTIWGIENVIGGSGDDTITASNAVNVMSGGAGNDVFRFETSAAAHGDTINGFEPGDRIDLSGIDANTGASGDQGFTLLTSAAFTAAGQLAVTYESGPDGDFTVVQGNTDGNTDADFTLKIEGHHALGTPNLTL
jgi:Ca2+-binding RTX toxin-like protein